MKRKLLAIKTQVSRSNQSERNIFKENSELPKPKAFDLSIKQQKKPYQFCGFKQIREFIESKQKLSNQKKPKMARNITCIEQGKQKQNKQSIQKIYDKMIQIQSHLQGHSRGSIAISKIGRNLSRNCGSIIINKVFCQQAAGLDKKSISSLYNQKFWHSRLRSMENTKIKTLLFDSQPNIIEHQSLRSHYLIQSQYSPSHGELLIKGRSKLHKQKEFIEQLLNQ